MKRKGIVAILLVLLVVGAALAVALTVQGNSGSSSARFKPCGTYVGLLGTPFRWTFTIIPDDPSGNTFAAILEYAEDEEGFNRSNDVFTAVRTGKNSYDMTSVHYHTEGGAFTQGEVVAIVVSSGPLTFSEDGEVITWSGTFASFLPEQGADLDGLPDEGEEPVFCFASGPVQGKRLHVIPPYPPTP